MLHVTTDDGREQHFVDDLGAVPAVSASKAAWVTYAQARGVVTDGLTKVEIQAAVAAL